MDGNDDDDDKETTALVYSEIEKPSPKHLSTTSHPGGLLNQSDVTASMPSVTGLKSSTVSDQG